MSSHQPSTFACAENRAWKLVTKLAKAKWCLVYRSMCTGAATKCFLAYMQELFSSWKLLEHKALCSSWTLGYNDFNNLVMQTL
jgi:hypothetical protein